MFRPVTLAGVLVLWWCGHAAAQTSENVAVIINDASPQSQRVGQYYAQKRSVPSSNVIRIRTPITETIDRGGYEASIEQPIAAAIARQSLQDRIRLALKLQPNNAMVLNNLAYGLAVHHKALAEAVGLAQRAVKLAPNDATVLDTLGWIEHLRGNTAVASKLLAQATQRGTTRPEIHLHAAIVYAESGAWAASEAQLAAALRLDPSLAAGKEVARLRERLAARR